MKNEPKIIHENRIWIAGPTPGKLDPIYFDMPDTRKFQIRKRYWFWNARKGKYSRRKF